MKKWANILLGIWLAVGGLLSLADVRFYGSPALLSLIAVAAGVLMLFADRAVKFSARPADIALGVWLVVAGLFPVLGVRFYGSHIVLYLLMLAAGILVLVRK